MALDLRTGAVNFERQRHELLAEQQRTQFAALYAKTYEHLETFTDELGVLKHKFRCIVCGTSPVVPEKNMRFWSGHCSCRPPQQPPFPEYKGQSTYGEQTRPRPWSNQ
jgi:hypothetical protein